MAEDFRHLGVPTGQRAQKGVSAAGMHLPYIVILEVAEFDEDVGDFTVGPEDCSYEKPELGDG